MRFLADMGVSMATVKALREKHHDIIHLAEEGLYRLPDDQILSKAEKENRVVLTFDLDFADLLATGAKKFPSVVLFRTRHRKPNFITERLFEILGNSGEELENGSIIMVSDSDYRVRHLPI